MTCKDNMYELKEIVVDHDTFCRIMADYTATMIVENHETASMKEMEFLGVKISYKEG